MKNVVENLINIIIKELESEIVRQPLAIKVMR